jgi:2-dehydro-3-deoxygluconokinase
MPDLVTLGEPMVLLLAEGSGPLREATTFRRFVAGAESNVAIGVVRLGHSAGIVTRLGDDEFGRAILFRLRGEGVDTTQVRMEPQARTGVYFRDARGTGRIEVLYYRSGSAASRMSAADLDPAYLAGARIVHLTGITPALSASCREATFAAAEMARSAEVPVTLDPNVRLRLWSADEARRVLRDLARLADVVLTGADEAELLTGEAEPEAAAKAIAKLGPKTVVMRLGVRGALTLSAGGIARVDAAAWGTAVDPVGAGDAFAAGFHAARLRDMDLANAAAVGLRCAAIAVASLGDCEALPSWEEVAGPDRTDVRR